MAPESFDLFLSQKQAVGATLLLLLLAAAAAAAALEATSPA